MYVALADTQPSVRTGHTEHLLRCSLSAKVIPNIAHFTCHHWGSRSFPFCKTSAFKEYLWSEISQQEVSKGKININSAISSTTYWWKKKSTSSIYPACFGSLLAIYIFSFLRGLNMCHNITSFAENFLNTWFCFILILSLSGTIIFSVYKTACRKWMRFNRGDTVSVHFV